MGQNYNLKKTLKRKKRELLLMSKNGSDLRDWIKQETVKDESVGYEQRTNGPHSIGSHYIRNPIQINRSDLLPDGLSQKLISSRFDQQSKKSRKSKGSNQTSKSGNKRIDTMLSNRLSVEPGRKYHEHIKEHQENEQRKDWDHL